MFRSTSLVKVTRVESTEDSTDTHKNTQSSEERNTEAAIRSAILN